jgi:hypothetical protein
MVISIKKADTLIIAPALVLSGANRPFKTPLHAIKNAFAPPLYEMERGLGVRIREKPHQHVSLP